MRWVERGALAAALICAGLAHADAPGYGKVETFQPGKKYNCVPTPDHKAWDCNESGKASERRVETAAPPAPAPSTDTTAESAPKASALPSYLKNSAQRGQAQAVAPPAPAATPASAPTAAPAPTPAPTAPAPAPAIVAAPAAPAEPTAPAAAPAVVAAPASPTAPAPAPAIVAAPVAPAASRDAGALGNREFLALPASSYVVEIAHSANRADLAALHASLHLPMGELYELHLTRDGGDWWLLVWGHFADIESARAARSDVPADAGVNAGWPRRIAPLQAEARRFND